MLFSFKFSIVNFSRFDFHGCAEQDSVCLLNLWQDYMGLLAICIYICVKLKA